MIDEYPVFTPLNIRHKNEVAAFVSRYEPYSDFNFTSLFCWGAAGSAETSWLNGNLVIKLPDYVTGEVVVSMLGERKPDESLRLLIEGFGKVSLVPEVTVLRLKRPDDFVITEDRDNFDYIYSLDDLAKLEGSAYKKKRNKLSAAAKKLADKYSVCHRTSIDEKQRAEFLDLYRQWASRSVQPASDIAFEKKAVKRLLDNSQSLDLIYTTVSIDGRLAGFSINEVLGKGYAISHFEKALPVHGNLYLLLANEAAAHLLAKTCEYVNWEQDLGLAGLRRSKMSYNPVKFFKKYNLELKG